MKKTFAQKYNSRWDYEIIIVMAKVRCSLSAMLTHQKPWKVSFYFWKKNFPARLLPTHNMKIWEREKSFRISKNNFFFLEINPLGRIWNWFYVSVCLEVNGMNFDSSKWGLFYQYWIEISYWGVWFFPAHTLWVKSIQVLTINKISVFINM